MIRLAILFPALGVLACLCAQDAPPGQAPLDVRMKVSLADGKILSGTIDNPVKARERDCSDAGFSNCGEARPHEILWRIEIALER
jgi:hypothetical protein